MNDKLLQCLGFASLAEMSELVAGVDLSTSEKLAAFSAWQAKDGTKDGLLKLSNKHVVDKRKFRKIAIEVEEEMASHDLMYTMYEEFALECTRRYIAEMEK